MFNNHYSWNPMHASEDPIIKRRGAYLPHWTRHNAVYAVTFRLADSLPQNVLHEILWRRNDILKTARAMHRPLTKWETAELKMLCSPKMNYFLRQGYGACWLRRDDIAHIVAQAFCHFDAVRYRLLAWCIMPNHVHVVLRPMEGWNISDILHSWKSFTSKKANKILGRSGTFWRPEYYDHLIRDDRELRHCIDYAWKNPEAARLPGCMKWKWRWKRSETDESDTGETPV